jgi:N-acetylglucosaminyldiphosphoundecaprenol N-acetyl-beta-D-mannosaminyltransferase
MSGIEHSNVRTGAIDVDRPRLESINILGVTVDRLSLGELLGIVSGWAETEGRFSVMYANVHVLNNAYADVELRRILNQAKLVYCDGAGVRLGTRLLGRQLPQRMTAADWIEDLCTLCAEWGLGLYLMGGRPGVAARAAEVLGSRYPGVPIVGSHHGYVSDPAVNEQALSEINAAAPRILLVGMGTPIQERWIATNRDRLHTPVVWAVGALFDFVAGVHPRAPRWMRHYNLEWLHRLAVEPRRLWRRYLIGNPIFLLRVLGQRWGLVNVK